MLGELVAGRTRLFYVCITQACHRNLYEFEQRLEFFKEREMMSNQRRKKSPKQKLDQNSAAVLDEDEQQKLIAELEQQARQQGRRAKVWISGLGLAVLLGYLTLAAHQAWRPWALLPHSPFEDVGMQPSSVSVAHLGSAAVVLLAALAVAAFSQQQEDEGWAHLLRVSGTIALMVTLFWSAACLRLARRNDADFPWRVVWLPVAPGAYVLAAGAVINTLYSLKPEFVKLRAARYRLKSA
jgi:anti-sigma factor RsiW